MIKPPGTGDVALAAGVHRTTVSAVLNGRGDKLRISPTTQARILAAARQLGVARRESGGGQGNTAVGAGMPRLPVGLVITASSPVDTLSLISRLEPELSAAGYPMVVITVPADPGGIRDRIFKSGVSGLLSCRTVYSSVSAFRSGICPVIVVWEGAAKALLALLGAPQSVASPLTAAPTTTASSPPLSVSDPLQPVATPVTAPAPQPQDIPVANKPLPVPIPIPVPEVARPLPEPVPEVAPVSPVPESAPIPEVATQPASVPEPEPVAVPVSKPEPVSAPISEPTPAPVPVPEVARPLPEPVPEVAAVAPVPEAVPVPEVVAQTVPVPEPEPVAVPVSKPEPVPAPIPEPAPAPIPEPAPAPEVARPLPEPVPAVAPVLPRPEPTPIPEVPSQMVPEEVVPLEPVVPERTPDIQNEGLDTVPPASAPEPESALPSQEPTGS